jgi:hypothetical protein
MFNFKSNKPKMLSLLMNWDELWLNCAWHLIKREGWFVLKMGKRKDTSTEDELNVGM